MTIRTSLLESRPLWGERSLYDEFTQRLAKEVLAGTGLEFVQAKLAERDERHRRLGDSRYALEPNIKEGKGGLRDLQTLFWIGKYLHQVDDADGLVDVGMQDDDLYIDDLGVVTFLGPTLFRATVEFPANVPTGQFTVSVYLFRDGDIVTAQTTPLVVSKIGLGAEVFDFSRRHAAAYGLVAIAVAVFFGWLASILFRSPR